MNRGRSSRTVQSIMPPMRIVITGANRGIGLELARRYVARGDQVIAGARRPEAAGDLDELARAYEQRLEVVKLDVTSAADVEALSAHLGKQPVDLLINNAGVSSPFSTLSDLNEAKLGQALDVFNVNALGPLRVTRVLSENLIVAKGRLVNVTSLMGSMEDNGSGRAYAYRMSKAALNMATTNMALELGPAGVTVVAINPGWVRTDLGGERAPTAVDECGAALETLFDGLTPAHNGQFLNWDGRRLPW